MSIKYSVVDFKFDLERWQECLQTVSPDDLRDFAAFIGVDLSTLQNWRSGVYRNSKFPYPSMTSFLSACNALDLIPGQFFSLIDERDI